MGRYAAILTAGQYLTAGLDRGSDHSSFIDPTQRCIYRSHYQQKNDERSGEEKVDLSVCTDTSILCDKLLFLLIKNQKSA